jgi:hypothetical protein
MVVARVQVTQDGVNLAVTTNGLRDTFKRHSQQPPWYG